MLILSDPPTNATLVTAVIRQITLDALLTIKCLRQGSRESLQFIQRFGREQIAVSHAPLPQTSFEKINR